MYVSCVHCLRPAGHQSASGCSQWWDETLCISTGGLLEAEKKKKTGWGRGLGEASGEGLRRGAPESGGVSQADRWEEYSRPKVPIGYP